MDWLRRRASQAQLGGPPPDWNRDRQGAGANHPSQVVGTRSLAVAVPFELHASTARPPYFARKLLWMTAPFPFSRYSTTADFFSSTAGIPAPVAGNIASR
jgi:hypothetical protein